MSSFFGGIPRRIIDLWRDGRILLCLSQGIVEEYIEVLSRLGPQGGKELEALIKLFAEGYNSLFAGSTPELQVVKDDPDDNKFIECAVELDCKVIVSGDNHLREIGRYIDIDILSPSEFWERLNG